MMREEISAEKVEDLRKISRDATASIVERPKTANYNPLRNKRPTSKREVYKAPWRQVVEASGIPEPNLMRPHPPNIAKGKYRPLHRVSATDGPSAIISSNIGSKFSPIVDDALQEQC